MRNTLSDLNNHLLEQLERLNDEDLTGEDLQQELQRSKAVSSIAQNVVKNSAEGFVFEYGLIQHSLFKKIEYVTVIGNIYENPELLE